MFPKGVGIRANTWIIRSCKLVEISGKEIQAEKNRGEQVLETWHAKEHGMGKG